MLIAERDRALAKIAELNVQCDTLETELAEIDQVLPLYGYDDGTQDEATIIERIEYLQKDLRVAEGRVKEFEEKESDYIKKLIGQRDAVEWRVKEAVAVLGGAIGERQVFDAVEKALAILRVKQA